MKTEAERGGTSGQRGANARNVLNGRIVSHNREMGGHGSAGTAAAHTHGASAENGGGAVSPGAVVSHTVTNHGTARDAHGGTALSGEAGVATASGIGEGPGGIAHRAADATARSGEAAAATLVLGGMRGAALPGASLAAAGVKGASVAADTAVLCNITEQRWILHRTHGMFCVAGCGEGELFTLTPIGARNGSIDLGDKRSLEFPIPARDIAADLAREINSDGGEASYFGVFVCEGSEPSEEELRAAHAQLDHFYRTLVASADRTWERTHNVILISDLERRAARALRLEKEWSYEPSERVDCPACGEKLRPGVAVCRVCRAVLNREKAAQFGLAEAPAAN